MTKKVFLSYSRKDLDVVRSIVDDLTTAGLHEPWYDQDLEGGKEWWDEIVTRIQDSDLFLVTLSRGSLESEACQLETRYAIALGKEVLPVAAEQISVNLLPEYLATRQIVDYQGSSKAGLYLVRAIEHAKPSRPLPEVLPEPPRVPISYLVELRDQILDLRAPLSLELQRSFVLRLRNARPDDVDDAVELLQRLRAREDTYAVARDEADSAIGALRQSAVVTDLRPDDDNIIVTDFPHDVDGSSNACSAHARSARDDISIDDDVGARTHARSARDDISIDDDVGARTHAHNEPRANSDTRVRFSATTTAHLRASVQRRNDTDYIFNFWTALGWTILSFGIYTYYIFFRLIGRSRDHNRRRVDVLDSAKKLAWEEAGRQSLQEELRPEFDRLAEHLTVLHRMCRAFRAPGAWVVLAILTGGLGLIVGWVLVDKDLLRHSAAEAGAEAELDVILRRLGCSVTPGVVTLKGAHSYVGRTIALICTGGLYGVWWMRNLELQGNRHLQENWVWEDSLLSVVAA